MPPYSHFSQRLRRGSLFPFLRATSYIADPLQSLHRSIFNSRPLISRKSRALCGSKRDPKLRDESSGSLPPNPPVSCLLRLDVAGDGQVGNFDLFLCRTLK
jgi:hypothetical protein